MNFLLRATQPAVPEVSTAVEPEDNSAVKSTPRPTTTLEGLIAEETFPSNSTENDANTNNNGDGVSSSLTEVPTSKSQAPVGRYTDVSEEDGWITIPYKDLPDNWTEITDIQHLRPLDRSFIFPGEHIHILVCLSASKQEAEIITPFRVAAVAAVMSKNVKSNQRKEQPIETLEETGPTNPNGVVSRMSERTFGQKAECNGKTVSAGNAVSQKDDISAPESLLRLEYHKQQTENMLESFRNSNFFVRIAEADEQLWFKRNAPLSMLSEVVGGRSCPNGGSQRVPKSNVISAVVDKGSFDGNKSGGMARETVRCHSLSNGDIVVLLEMNVGVNYLEDPVLEVIQFEKYSSGNSAIEARNVSLAANNDDPCRELLNWLLPLDRSLPPRSVSPPLGSSMSQKTVYPAPGSQIFSFSNFRSYSMSSVPQVSGPPSPASFSTANPVSELEDYDRFSKEKLRKSPDTGNAGLLSFRGIPLEPERFSAHCGLEGIYLPGRRWRRKLEIIQPVEIHSFAAECNTEDLLCVQIKNISPAHLPDIVIFLDAITIVSEEASKGGPPLFLPVASIETGNGHSLPNLALRSGEEHSFILKLATLSNRDHKIDSNMVPYSRTGSAAPNAHMTSNINDGMMATSAANQFSIVASCRCNYSESKLFFKKSTNWKPRITKDLMISIAAEFYSHQKPSSQNCRELQLPVKVLTLKATNLTSEDLTFTVLAPETASSPSVLSLSSTPKTSMNSSSGFSWDKSSAPIAIKFQNESIEAGKTSNFVEQTATMSDVISNNPGFSHLWLQSSVPLGCIPAFSSASVKLELLPLTDGIVTLDTLQIAVKEKGMTFKPEHSLKIHATSSISSGIL